jgi:DNA-binding response OmpR family regulator
MLAIQDAPATATRLGSHAEPKMNSNAHNRVLLVEDEAAVARGVEYGLAKEGFTVTWVDGGLRALDVVRNTTIDIVLLDARLPDISGFDVLKRMRAEGRRQPIIMVTARDEETDRVLGLELGADDYVVKPFSLRELISRVRASLRRAYGELSAPSGDDELRLGNILVNFTKLSARKNEQPLWLTPTEFKLLRHLASHPRMPLSREAIIQAVWGYAGEVEDDRTIDVHVRHLREKLEEDPANPRWICTVRGIGYKFEP